MRPARSATDRRQRGSATVEFAMAGLVFFLLAFGMMELARVIYLWNTAAAMVRQAAHAAAVSNFADPGAMEAVRNAAMPLGSNGRLVLGGSIDPDYLRIDYLDRNRAPLAALPPCPVLNYLNCADKPGSANGANCIRYVRVRLCVPGTDCSAVPYEPLLAFDSLIGRGMVTLPTFQATVPAGTFGYRAGAAAGSCP